MNAYLELIERLDREDSAELINNSSTQHAILLIARLFARGRRDIDVFSGSLDPEIYTHQSVVDALGVFLVGRGGTLRLLIQREVDLGDPSGLISRLRSEFGDDVVRKRVQVRFAAESLRVSAPAHFLVVDGQGFRFEPDTSSHKAVASFNLPSVATRLQRMFREIFASGRVALAS